MIGLERRLSAVRYAVAGTLLGLAAFFVPLTGVRAAAGAGKVRVYVGTYTGGESRGIYRFVLDLASGGLAVAGEPTPTSNPSFLALHPGGRFLYAVNEDGRSPAEDDRGAVSAFAVDAATGALSLLNQQPSGGAAPCHLALDGGGHHLLVANYGGGSVAVLPVQDDGRLGKATVLVRHQGSGANKERQQRPHAHAVGLDAANRFALVADLGLDKLLVYRFDPGKGTLSPNDPPAASVAAESGPRHFAFHPGGGYVYLINEMSSTVTAFGYRADAGALAELQTVSTVPAGFAGANSTAEIAVSPDGRFLYGSNRGHDSIAIFAIDGTSGKLSPLAHQATLGKKPRNFAIDPTGAYLLAANQDSDNIAVFRIDKASGRLTPVGSPVHAPRPVCVTMAPLSN